MRHDNENTDEAVPIEVPEFLERALREIQDMDSFGMVSSLGFTMMHALPEILPAIERAAKREATVIRRELALLSPHVTSEVNSDFSYLNSLLVVRLVTIIETIVADAVIWSLIHNPSVLKDERLRRIKGPLVEFASTSEAERAQYLANALAQELGVGLKVGVGKYEALLGVVDLGGALDPLGRRTLCELVEMRNVVVHKGGRADARFIERCPWLHATMGDHLRIDMRMLDRYRAATSYYLMSITERWAVQRGKALSDYPSYQQVLSRALRQLSETK